MHGNTHNELTLESCSFGRFTVRRKIGARRLHSIGLGKLPWISESFLYEREVGMMKWEGDVSL